MIPQLLLDRNPPQIACLFDPLHNASAGRRRIGCYDLQAVGACLRAPSAASAALLSPPHHPVPQSSHRRSPPTSAEPAHSAPPTGWALVFWVLGWGPAVAQ